MEYVKNISTKQEKKKKDPRVSRAQKDSGREKCAQETPSKREEKAFGVITTRFFVVRKIRGAKKPFFVSVSKSVAKKATERNLLKRRIRSILKNTIREGFYCVVVKPAAHMVSFQELKDDLSRVFLR